MPGRWRSKTPLTLEDFLRGLFAALTIVGRRRVRTGPRVLGEAIYWTLRDLQASFRRHRVRPTFRVRRTASSDGRGALAQALRRLEADGLIRLPLGPRGDIELLADEAYAKEELRRVDAMIPLAAWAVRCFLRRHATARVRDARAAVREAVGASDVRER